MDLQTINLKSCCVSLINSVESMMIYGLANHKLEKLLRLVG